MSKRYPFGDDLPPDDLEEEKPVDTTKKLSNLDHKDHPTNKPIKPRKTFLHKRDHLSFRKEHPEGYIPGSFSEKYGATFPCATNTTHQVGRIYLTDKFRDPKRTNRPKLHYTAKEKPFVSFTLQVQDEEFWKSDYYMYLPWTAWEGRAEYVADHCYHGMLVAVMGKASQTQVHLDDKICRECGHPQTSRRRSWINFEMMDMKILPTESYPARNDPDVHEKAKAIWEKGD